MATKRSDNTSDELIDKTCSVCAGQNVTREAEKYCVECQDYYCVPCTDIHKTIPAMRGHKLLDKADFSTRSLRTALPCIPTDRCQIHNTELIDMFCNDHDEVVCATCVAIDHRDCQDIHSIPNEIDILYNQSALDRSMTQIIEEKNALESTKTGKQQLLEVLKKKRELATKSIIEYRKKLEAQLKRLEAKSINQVDAIYNSMEQDLQNEIQETEKHIDELEQSSDKLRKSNENKAQRFVRVKTAQKTIFAVSNFRNSLTTDAYDVIHFSSNMEIRNYLQQLHELGQVSTQDETFWPRTTAYKVKQQKDIDIKMKSDNNTSSIDGSCFTKDGCYLLADTSNNKLKCLDMSTETIIDHLDLEAMPFDVCLIGEQEAAVSMNNNTIQFVSLGNQMTTTRKLKMDHYCSRLAYNDGKLYISDQGSAVYIHELNGTKLTKITSDKYGQPIFGYHPKISLSTNRDCLYIADFTKGLITFDLLGNHISTFNGSYLFGPKAVCTDGRGNMFVFGCTSSKVFQISEKSKTKLCTIKTNLKPSSVSFDPYNNKLITSHDDRDSVTAFWLR